MKLDWVDKLSKVVEVKGGTSSGNVNTKVEVYPATYEELAETVRLCAEEKLKAYVHGFNAHHIGKKVSADVGISTLRLNKEIEMSEEDLYVKVQAGASFRELKEELKAHSLTVPFNYSGSVGGFASTNLPSVFTSLGYPKDWLLGAIVVTGLGEVVKSGSTTTKFSSGYKIWKVLSGSLGWLGAYAELNVRLLPYFEYHFEEVRDHERAFKERALGVIGVKVGEEVKKFAVKRGDGEKLEIPEVFDFSVLSIRGKEFEEIKGVNADFCVAYYGLGIVRCLGGTPPKGKKLVKERGCEGDCFNANYTSLRLLKKSLDPRGVFFDVI